MMKRQYIKPAIDLESMEEQQELLAVSSPVGIGYGGVDADGTKDPSARTYNFDDDEDMD